MSFRKFKSTSKTCPGTRISIINGQILTSCGVSSLDEVVGGGLPLGRILLVKADRFTAYSQLLLKYFIAQGIAHKQSVSLSSVEAPPEEIFTDLMSIVEGKQESALEAENDENDGGNNLSGGGAGGTRQLGALRNRGQNTLSIAWRYQKTPQFTSSLQSEFKGPNNSTYCHSFDLTKKIDTAILNSSSLYLNGADSIFQGLDPADDCNGYQRLLEILQTQIKEHTLANASNPKVLRIAVDSIGSPSWLNGKTSLNDIIVFVEKLKHIVRGTNAVVLVTIPAYLYNDYHNRTVNPLIRRIEHAADAVLEVESFSGTPNFVDEKYTSDYHGLVHPRKVFSYEASMPSTRLGNVELHSLGFKVRRKRFLVEPFILPPEMDDEVKKDTVKSSQLQISKPNHGSGCSATSASNSLDF